MVLKFTNTLSGELEEFTPKNPLEVRMYVCGPTVYNYAHIGNARPAVIFDVLYRLLKEEYKAVLYARNYTDVDDKINAKAAADGVSIELLTNKYIDAYRADTMALGVLAPDFEPRVTDNIVPIKQMIFRLVDQGFAYVVDGHVLFEVEKYRDYGNLAGRNVEDMIAGARIEVAPYKRNPADFVLWKPSRNNEPGWQADWGYGRPGWHIECSAMINDLFGDYVDIHGGGADLIFPHHENEIAQSCCAYPESEFARYWLHNEMLQVDGKKMSKSLGNFFTVRDLLDQGYPGEVIRFVFLSTHYSKPMDWNNSKALEAKNILRKWRGLLKNNFEIVPLPEEAIKILSDDLNTAGVISLLHKYASNGEIGKLKAGANFLGILTQELSDWCADVDMSSLEGLFTDLRKRAIESKNFENIDELRSKLTNAGVDVQIGKSNVALVPNASFDLQEVNKIINFYGLN